MRPERNAGLQRAEAGARTGQELSPQAARPRPDRAAGLAVRPLAAVAATVVWELRATVLAVRYRE